MWTQKPAVLVTTGDKVMQAFKVDSSRRKAERSRCTSRRARRAACETTSR